eukprot:scaffold2340_cov113-Isochrysis_galbana.AAC.6
MGADKGNGFSKPSSVCFRGWASCATVTDLRRAHSRQAAQSALLATSGSTSSPRRAIADCTSSAREDARYSLGRGARCRSCEEAAIAAFLMRSSSIACTMSCLSE